MSAIDDKYLARIRKILDSMTERDKVYFQQNKKTKRAISLRKLLDQWAAEYRDVLKVSMSEAYDTIYKLEKNAIEGKKINQVDKPPRLILGSTVPAASATSATRYRKYVDNKVKQGFADGFDVYQLLAGTPAARFRDGAIFSRNKSAKAHIGNSVMTGANDGRLVRWQQLDADRYTWSSTLDGKTCSQCAELDGQVWKREDLAILPPAHSACRCALLEYEGEREGGTRGALEDFELKRKTDPERIDAYLVKGKTTFKTWFPTTSARFQKDYLGPTRYKAWKAGEFTFDEFTDKYGRKFTLEELGLEQVYK